jgi:hypothetical protein
MRHRRPSHYVVCPWGSSAGREFRPDAPMPGPSELSFAFWGLRSRWPERAGFSIAEPPHGELPGFAARRIRPQTDRECRARPESWPRRAPAARACPGDRAGRGRRFCASERRNLRIWFRNLRFREGIRGAHAHRRRRSPRPRRQGGRVHEDRRRPARGGECPICSRMMRRDR